MSNPGKRCFISRYLCHSRFEPFDGRESRPALSTNSTVALTVLNQRRPSQDRTNYASSFLQDTRPANLQSCLLAGMIAGCWAALPGVCGCWRQFTQLAGGRACWPVFCRDCCQRRLLVVQIRDGRRGRVSVRLATTKAGQLSCWHEILLARLPPPAVVTS